MHLNWVAKIELRGPGPLSLVGLLNTVVWVYCCTRKMLKETETGRWSVRFSSGSQHHGPNLHSEANLREILGVWQRSLCMLCRS